MNLRRRRLLLAAAFALGLALSFPFRAGSFAFDVGAVAGWVALAPLSLLCRGLGPRDAFVWSFGASWAGYALALYWLYIVVRIHGGAGDVAGVAAVLAVTAAFAAHAGAAAALAVWLAPRLGRAGVLVLPAAWIVAEQLRSFDFLGGFPWAYLGYAFHADAPLRALASWTGVYGLGFLAALGGALLGAGRIRAALALILLAHAAGFGAWFAVERSLAPAPEKRLRVALVQGNIPQDEKWNPARARRNFDVHLELSREAIALAPDAILWPEAALSGFVEAQPEFRDPLLELAAQAGVPLVVGGVGVTFGPGPRDYTLFNSVFVLTPEPRIVDRYDKSVLVPFGEYVPLRSVFGFLSAVATEVANISDITPGAGARPLRGLEALQALPGANLPAALICYEAVYPDVVRAAVRGGANLLWNLTNDAWYERSSAPDQFLAIARLRSAEHGLPMLRVANTGISAVIDARGAILARTGLFERKVLLAEVPDRVASPTPYTRVGDWPIAAAWAFLLASGGIVLVRRRER